MSPVGEKHPAIHGSVAPGFEAVEQLFAHEMRVMAERGAQLCVYHRGTRVVDTPGVRQFAP